MRERQIERKKNAVCHSSKRNKIKSLIQHDDREEKEASTAKLAND